MFGARLNRATKGAPQNSRQALVQNKSGCKVADSRTPKRHLLNQTLQPEACEAVANSLRFLGKQPAYQENNTEQDMQPMISGSEFEWTDRQHPIHGRVTHRHS